MNTEILNIAICDDEKAHRESLINVIKKYCKIHGKLAVVSEYSSGEECLSNLDEIEILFLDIDMEGMDGIEVKERLEKTQENIIIIYTTNYDNRMDEAFGIQVISFLRKPVTLEAVSKAMDKILKWHGNREFIEVEGSGGKKTIFAIEQITYIESSNQYSIVRLRKGEIFLRKSLNAWEKELDGKGFCRIHQSVIINFMYVKEVGKNVIMEDSKVFPISTRRRKAVVQAYSDYVKCRLIM